MVARPFLRRARLPRLAAAAAAATGRHSALRQPPARASRSESHDRPAEGSRGAGVCAAAEKPAPSPRWNNAQRPARSR